MTNNDIYNWNIYCRFHTIFPGYGINSGRFLVTGYSVEYESEEQAIRGREEGFDRDIRSWETRGRDWRKFSGYDIKSTFDMFMRFPQPCPDDLRPIYPYSQ